MIQGIKIIILI